MLMGVGVVNCYYLFVVVYSYFFVVFLRIIFRFIIVFVVCYCIVGCVFLFGVLIFVNFREVIKIWFFEGLRSYWFEGEFVLTYLDFRFSWNVRFNFLMRYYDEENESFLFIFLRKKNYDEEKCGIFLMKCLLIWLKGNLIMEKWK